jgi:hypothetical protein
VGFSVSGGVEEEEFKKRMIAKVSLGSDPNRE